MTSIELTKAQGGKIIFRGGGAKSFSGGGKMPL